MTPVEIKGKEPVGTKPVEIEGKESMGTTLFWRVAWWSLALRTRLLRL
jgi:hypothetical protein